MKKSLRQKSADFIVETKYGELSKQVIDQTKRCILDFLGVSLAGSKVGLAPLITDMICAMGGAEQATIIGDGRRIPALNAALVNGAGGHTLDMDDGHRYANAHPGVAIIPAALALGERENVTGKKLIESLVVGYETFLHIATAINPSHLKRGFHTTGTVGPFGAAAACSKLLGLDKKQVENALSIAGLQGAGLLEVTASGQMMKPLHPGKAAQAGVMASLLAKEGAEGPDSILEGEKGFLRAFSDVSDLGKGGNDLGSNFEIRNTYFKIYAACRHVHPTLDAVKEIMNKNTINISEIRNIDAHIYSVAYALAGHREAKTELAAKFSLPVSVGIMMVYGKAGVDEYSMEHVTNPVVQNIAEKVTMVVDKARDEVYPNKRSSRVTIETLQGAYSHEVDIPRGDPEDPWTDDELKEKFSLNAAKILPEEKVVDLHRCAFDIENRSIRELMGYVW